MDAQEIVRAVRESVGDDCGDAGGYAFVGENWLPGGDLSGDGERQVVVEKPDIAGAAGLEFDPSLAQERAEMRIDSRLGFQSEGGGDFGPGWERRVGRGGRSG